MGSLLRYPGDWLEPRDTRAVLDFAAQVTRGTSVIVDLADCLGYYTVQNREVGAKRGPDGADWVGCHAGKRAFGIRHNGDISACNSIRMALASKATSASPPSSSSGDAPGPSRLIGPGRASR